MLDEGTRKSNDEIIKRKTIKGDILKLQIESKSTFVPKEAFGDSSPLINIEQMDDAQDRSASEFRIKEHEKRLH